MKCFPKRISLVKDQERNFSDHWYEVLGKEAEKDFEIDELISCKG